jgi:hypothetical protein
MSVWVSAILEHHWKFSQKKIQEVARAISNQLQPIEWSNIDSFSSPNSQFAATKSVLYFLPDNFNLWFGKKTITLEHTDRWSRFLTNKQSRQHFLKASKTLAKLTKANEMLILPEGTILEDLRQSGSFDDFKREANKIWGLPNLDIDRIYTENEAYQNSGKRVNYFLIDAIDT